MTTSQMQHYTVLVYVLFWASRIRGVIRRGKQPHLRGSGWFFNVPVPAGFYEAPGQRILRAYWLRMAIPFALDIPAIGMLLTGHTSWVPWVIVALVPIIHLNHLYNVNIAERQAWHFAKAEDTQAAITSTVGLSLTPRRLKDYTNWPLEWAIILATVAAALVLAHIYRTVPEKHNIRAVFWAPAFYLYLQLGILLVKRVIVTWSAPVPMAQTAEHTATRDAMRKYYLRMCDWNRIAATVGIVFCPLLLSAPKTKSELLMRIWLGSWLALSVAGAVWIEIRRKQLAEMGLKARPVRMPNLMGQAGIAKWPVCYQPELPMLVLQGARGYSLNLANTVAYLSVAYLTGMVFLLMLARVGH
jgi:hypothetical protein